VIPAKLKYLVTEEDEGVTATCVALDAFPVKFPVTLPVKVGAVSIPVLGLNVNWLFVCNEETAEPETALVKLNKLLVLATVLLIINCIAPVDVPGSPFGPAGPTSPCGPIDPTSPLSPFGP
jgi:hypothetical protein